MVPDNDSSYNRQNISINESKVIRVLIENSRMTNEEIARETNLSRNTVAGIITSLIQRGIIKNFTINMKDPDEEIVAIAAVDNLDGFPPEDILEYYELSNGTFMVMLPESYLRKKFDYSDLKISIHHFRNDRIQDRLQLYCDYCGKPIHGDGIKVLWKRKVYYACCPNCEKDLKRKLEKENI